MSAGLTAAGQGTASETSNALDGLEAFRRDVVEFLEAEVPQSLRGRPLGGPFEGFLGGQDKNDAPSDVLRWLEVMAERGWTAPTWPRQYGGGGLSDAEATVLDEELRARGIPKPLVGVGLMMIGPILLRYGSEAQKLEHLPRICRGDVRWCQGYSEPGAGSDLASLSTRAIRDGDEYVINGQKIWTSFANVADWIFCLVRTTTEVKKQAGITFLLMDMTSPGISVKPILLISGASPFCEVFFEDVRVPVDHVVHEVDKGWTVAKALLGHERSSMGQNIGIQAQEALERIVEIARKGDVAQGPLSDALLRDAIARQQIQEQCFRYTVERLQELDEPGAESSILKIVGSEVKQGRWSLSVRALGNEGIGWAGEGFDTDALKTTRHFLRSRANTIEGGTSEIQLNIIAKHVLGLGVPAGPAEGVFGVPTGYDEDTSMLADTVRRLVRERCDVGRIRRMRDDATSSGIDESLFSEMAELGFLGLTLPEQYGGSELGLRAQCAVVRELGRGLSPEPVWTATSLGASMLSRFGSERLRQEWLESVISGERLITLATEEKGTPFLGTPSLAATRDGEGFVLQGQKTLVPDGHIANAFIVSAACDGARSLFFVPADASGVTVTRQHLIDGRGAALVSFDDVLVGEGDVVGELGHGAESLEVVFNRAAIALSAEMLGAAEQAFDDTVAYLKTREQFGQTLGAFQALQHRAARMYMGLQLGSSIVWAAARAVDEGASEVDVAKLSSMAKAYMSELFAECAAEAVQLHGGIGVTDEHDIGFYFKRAQVAAIQLGDAGFHRRRVAELSGY